MKKRKPPILLISLIIMMLIGVVIMNSPQTNKPGGNNEPVVDKGRETDSAEDLASKQKEAIAKTDIAKTSKVRAPLPEEIDRKNRETAPAIKVAKPGQASKQVPNDNSQMGQWYTDQSATANQKGIQITAPPK